MLFRHALTSFALVTAVVAVSFLSAAPASAASYFDDTAGTTYDGAVRALADRGVVDGCDEGRFCPGNPLKRGQLASVLAAALDLPPSESDHFRDDDGSHHEASINALADAGVTTGCGEGDFCPDLRITRAEMASMLARAFELPDTEQDFFGDVYSVHADAVDVVAAAGITSGCGVALTTFCPEEHLPRWQAAVFVARAMDLVPRVTPITLADRQAEQEALDAERRRQAELAAIEAEEAAARAEREAIWDALAQCESGGNWSINTGNGYYGGLQFSLSSWRAVGGSGYPHQHSRAEQILRGERLQALQGWGAWPTCSRKLGLR